MFLIKFITRNLQQISYTLSVFVAVLRWATWSEQQLSKTRLAACQLYSLLASGWAAAGPGDAALIID